MYEPPALHSVTRLGEPRATPAAPSIGTSQTATAFVSVSLKSVSRRPSGNCRPVSAIRCPWGTLNTTDAEPPAIGIDSTAVSDGPLVKSARSPSVPQVADPVGPSSTRCRGAEPSRRSTDRSRELPAILRRREPSGVEITGLLPATQRRSGVACRRPPRDPSPCTSPSRTPRHESVFRRRSRRTHPFRACLQSAGFRPCR